jgi:hypothetical protein
MVDHHIFMDNGSQDGTLGILTALKKEGLPLSVFQNKCVSFNEANHLTFLFREAALRHGADWVTCLDADEFLDDRFTESGLTLMLEGLAAEPNLVSIKLPSADLHRHLKGLGR